VAVLSSCASGYDVGVDLDVHAGFEAVEEVEGGGAFSSSFRAMFMIKGAALCGV